MHLPTGGYLVGSPPKGSRCTVCTDYETPIAWSNPCSWTQLKCGHNLCTDTCTSGKTTLVPFSMNGGFLSLMSGGNSCFINKSLQGSPLKSRFYCTSEWQKYLLHQDYTDRFESGNTSIYLLCIVSSLC